jgi:hypothetical protein
VTGGVADQRRTRGVKARALAFQFLEPVSQRELLSFESAQSGSNVFDFVLGAEIRPGGHGSFQPNDRREQFSLADVVQRCGSPHT